MNQAGTRRQVPRENGKKGMEEANSMEGKPGDMRYLPIKEQEETEVGVGTKDSDVKDVWRKSSCVTEKPSRDFDVDKFGNYDIGTAEKMIKPSALTTELGHRHPDDKPWSGEIP